MLSFITDNWTFAKNPSSFQGFKLSYQLQPCPWRKRIKNCGLSVWKSKLEYVHNWKTHWTNTKYIWNSYLLLQQKRKENCFVGDSGKFLRVGYIIQSLNFLRYKSFFDSADLHTIEVSNTLLTNCCLISVWTSQPSTSLENETYF